MVLPTRFSSPTGSSGVPSGLFLPDFSPDRPVFGCRAAPAPGFRDSGGRGASAGGTLWRVGVNGYGWAASFTETYAYRLYFNSGTVNPSDSGNRGYGFQLRCLQE